MQKHNEQSKTMPEYSTDTCKLSFNQPISITPSSTHIMHLNALILTGSAWNVSVRLTEHPVKVRT